MGRRKRKIRHGEKRVWRVGKDGKMRTGIQKVKCWCKRGEYKRSEAENRRRADKMVGRVGRWYRITPQDDFLQANVVRKIRKAVLEELRG